MVRYRDLLAIRVYCEASGGAAAIFCEIDDKQGAELTTRSETAVFGHLRDSDYPARSFDTGHPAYDRFLAGVKEWLPDYRALDPPEALTRATILREMPFIAPIEAEPAENLGRAMLINAYAVPKLGDGWFRHPLELRDRIQFAQLVFYAFTRQLPHARLSAADAEALLREIPEALFQDELVLFTELFFRSFPQRPPASLEDALNDFVDGFFAHCVRGRFGVLDSHSADEMIGRHLQFLAFLGRAPESLPFYRERSRVFEIARRQAATLLPQLGPLHARYAAVTDNGKRKGGLYQEEARQFQAVVENASPSERGQMVADQCRVKLMRLDWEETCRWLRAGLPFWLGNLAVPQLDLVDQVEREMQLTPEQACIILEYMALHGNKYASNYPTLSYRLARTLSGYLPTVRPDLERLVKDTTYNTDQPTKELLLDALRGEKPGFFERLLRRFLPKFFAPEDKPEMWGEWIADKRRTLLAQIDTTPPIGRAAPRSAQVPDWGHLNGQLYHVDAVGYAKRIARAQSGGADVSAALEDLRRLAAMARANLAVLEASVGRAAVPPPVRTEGEDETAPPQKSDQVTPRPSLFGLQEPPTDAQLIDCERRTLAALDGLVTRIELIRRHPDLVPFEHALRNPVEWGPYGSSDDFLRKGWIDGRMQNGVPHGVVERIDGIDFDLLDGPYLFDTEPSFTEAEFAAWRGVTWALSYIPEKTAIPALQQVIEKCFATSLTPNHAGWNYARQGYRAEDLGKAALWALEQLPGKAGMAILSDFQSRAYPGDLRELLREAIRRIEQRK